MRVDDSLRLSGLQVLATPCGVSPLSPSFSPDITSYSITADSDISEIEIIATVGVPAAHRIRVAGAIVSSGTAAAIALKPGDNTILLEVGDDGALYTLHCLKEDITAVEDAFLRLIWTDEETGITMGYRLLVPADYTPAKSWPLVLFLHGAGESGSDNEAQLAAVYNLLRRLMGAFSIDADRLYATGLSMGGFGVFALEAAHPDTLAAIVSVCGGMDPAQAPLLARKPTWLFHAEDDPLVNVRFSRITVEALRAAGGSPRYTEYPKGTRFIGSSAHGSWVPAYADAAMRDWLFAQRRPATP